MQQDPLIAGAATNLFDGDLELLNYERLAAIVAALGDEAERLELKRDWPANRDLAYEACAMGNAQGGVIVIGFNDAKANCTPYIGVDATPTRLTSAIAAVSAWSAPSVRVKARIFHGAGGLFAVALAVPRAITGPYEYLGRDKPHNLPVRRERATITNLSLIEIRAFLSAGSTTSTSGSLVSTAPWHLNALREEFLAGVLAPKEGPAQLLAFTKDEDDALRSGFAIEAHIEANPSGVIFRYGDTEAYVLRDGTHAVKENWNGDWPAPWARLYDLVYKLYTFGSHGLRTLGLPPRASGHVRWNTQKADVNPQRAAAFPFPKSGGTQFDVDFSRQDFVEFAFPIVVEAERSVQERRSKEQVESELAKHWQQHVEGGDVLPDLRLAWL